VGSRKKEAYIEIQGLERENRIKDKISKALMERSKQNERI